MADNGGQSAGLAWPDHDRGPAPPPEYNERREPETRRRLAWWDRTKFLLLLGGLWLFLFWKVIVDLQAGPQQQPQQVMNSQGQLVTQVIEVPPHAGHLQRIFNAEGGELITVAEELAGEPLATIAQVALNIALTSFWWLLALAAIELIRQLHFFLSERSAGYHRFWTQSFFGGFQRRADRMDDWNRFRLMRALKILFLIVILDLVLAAAYDVHPVVAIFQAPVAFFQYLPLVLQLVVGFFFVIVQFVGLFWFLSRGGVDVYMPEDVKTRFDNVWGQDHVVDKVKENMIFLEDPESIEDKGGYLPGGILLWGPPGTGKTLMAEAVAGETGKPFVFVDPGAFIQMFMGIGILKVKGLFRKLRKLALRYGGVIVFFDEADSLGNRGMAVAGRGGWAPFDARCTESRDCNGLAYMSPEAAGVILKSELEPAAAGPRPGLVNRFVMGMGMGGGGMGTLQALLTEISGLKKPRGFMNRYVRRALGMRPKQPPKYRILIMMATNTPQALDPALLRPGRIDRIYKVGYPSKAGRIRTYEGYLAKVRHNLTPEEIDRLAVITPYATGASIKDLVNEALINSIRENRPYITWQDIIRARLLKALGPPEDVEYIERERHAVAIHEACHAVVAYRMRRHLMIDIATIEKGQDYLGMVASIPLEEQFTRWKSEYEADLMVALAALVGEKMFYEDDNSSGVSADLSSATTIAFLMEGYWGMGETIGSHAATKPSGSGYNINDVSRNILETELGRRVERRLAEIIDRTRALLEANRTEILAVAHALEAHKTLTGEDVVAVIEGRVGPLVDGRPYRSPAFGELAEAYHRRALAAHKDHGRVDIPLPALDGLAGTGTSVASRPFEFGSDHT